MNAPDGVSPLPRLLAFAIALRDAGLHTSVDHDQTFVSAVSHLSVYSRNDIYWSGRAALCSSPDDQPLYDSIFASWFGNVETLEYPDEQIPRVTPQAEFNDDSDPPAHPDDEDPTSSVSEHEVLRNRDIAELSEAEQNRLWSMFTTLRVREPMRRSRRFDSHQRGDVDRAATVRDQLRRAGEPAPLRRRKRRLRPARVVVLIDVSGSMEPYADALLRLAHRVAIGTRNTEIFTLGTRLTHVTRALKTQEPSTALDQVGRAVPDWSGGTRLGEAVGAFNRRWGRAGMARGSVVIVASDGLERGDAALLGVEIETLHRLAKTIIWINPHRGKIGYEPVQGGMAAALPHIDHLVAGHSLEAFQQALDTMG